MFKVGDIIEISAITYEGDNVFVILKIDNENHKVIVESLATGEEESIWHWGTDKSLGYFKNFWKEKVTKISK